eukprot:jgi/Tetstr1/431906/TSEL_021395.t1
MFAAAPLPVRESSAGGAVLREPDAALMSAPRAPTTPFDERAPSATGIQRAHSVELPPLPRPAGQPASAAAHYASRGEENGGGTSSEPGAARPARSSLDASAPQPSSLSRLRFTSDTPGTASEVSSSASSPFVSRAGSIVSLTEPAEVGTWTLKCVRGGMASSPGCRSYMEDRQVAVLDLAPQMPNYDAAEFPQTRAYFAVFDGHGGSDAAQFTADHLLANILADASFPDQLERVLTGAIAKTDQVFEQQWAAGDLADSGTTALAAVLWGRMLTFANLGDCRAVVCRRGKAHPITVDQKPTDIGEAERIAEAGGHVCCEGYLNGVLGVARAIGNWHVMCDENTLLKRKTGLTGSGRLLTEGPLIAVPEVSTHRITPDDEFMVLATDGLWDVYTSQRCIEEARMKLQETNDPQACAEHLVASALQRNTADNVSVQVVCFGEAAPPQRRPSLFARNLSVEGLNKLREALNETPAPSPSAGLGATPLGGAIHPRPTL